ncbi:NADPH-dependent FMN reductase [Fusibacter bizertensis]
MKTIGIVVGSIRKGSFSQSVADYIASKPVEGFEFKFIDIANLPLYNQDYDENSPEAYVAFRNEVKAVDAVLFVTPEHNRSFSAALKNALDVASRPYGQNVWSGKPAAVVSQSPGAISGFGAYHHLKQVLGFLNLFVLPQPEVYLGNIMNSLDENGKLSNENVQSFLDSFVGSFVQWINKF